VEFAMGAVVLAIFVAIVIRSIPGSSAPPPLVPHSATLPTNGHSSATLQVVSGTPALTIDVASPDISGTLLKVTTPAGSTAPQLRETSGPGGAAVITLSVTKASAIKITLDAAVSWRLALAGGTTRTIADLRGSQVTGISVTKGSDVIDLMLPRPSGSVPVTLAAGASQFVLSLPSVVPVRVTAAAGAGEISLYGQNHAGVPGGAVFTTPTWAPGKAGFDIDATAGAAHITVKAQAS
jgi:hypothetical protein